MNVDDKKASFVIQPLVKDQRSSVPLSPIKKLQMKPPRKRKSSKKKKHHDDENSPQGRFNEIVMSSKINEEKRK